MKKKLLSDLKIGSKVLVDNHIICFDNMPRCFEAEVVAMSFSYVSLQKIKIRYIKTFNCIWLRVFFGMKTSKLVERWIDRCWVEIIDDEKEN